MKRFTSYLFLPFVCLATYSNQSTASIPTTCEPNQECLVDMPGSTCADGTQSFFTLTSRPGATKLLVYLTGGGACWSEASCKAGYASPLTRQETPTDWNGGSGIFNASDSNNPFAQDYNIVTVPYCSGDAYAGKSDTNYGTTKDPYVMHHQGYNNVQMIFKQVKQMFPSPDQVVLFGCSAGGIGAYYHERTLASTYSNVTNKMVISDAGTPFRPPYITQSNYEAVMKAWGAQNTLPSGVTDFSELIKHNTTTNPDIKFGFISSYNDEVMTFFALAVGSSSPFSAVQSTIVDLANDYINGASNAKVFYVDGSEHCHTGDALASVTSVNTNLGAWMTEMVNDTSGWDNVRPDLSSKIRSHVTHVPRLDEIQRQWNRP